MIALVVEDHPAHRDLVCAALEEAGWRVELAEDGVAALGRAALVRPDVLVLDIVMPHLDGAEFLRRLRGMPWGRSIRVVLATGAPVPAEVRALADALLVKPFEGEALVRAVEGTGPPPAGGAP